MTSLASKAAASQETTGTRRRYRPGAGHVGQGLLQTPPVVVLVQFHHLVVGADLVEDIFGHSAEGAGALGEDHHAVLRHHFLEGAEMRDVSSTSSSVETEQKRPTIPGRNQRGRAVGGGDGTPT